MQRKYHLVRLILMAFLAVAVAVQQVLPIFAQEATESARKQLFLPLVTVNDDSSGLSSAITNADGATGNTLRYAVGRKYIYHWNANTSVRSYNRDNATRQMVADATHQMQAGAVAELTPVGAGDGGSTLIQLTVLNPTIAYQDKNGTFVNTNDDELVKLLATPLYFEQKPTGQISGIIYSTRETPDTVNLKRGIISALQTQLQGGSTFAAAESDVSGTYIARYQQEATKGGLLITKNRDQNSYSAFADPAVRDRSFLLNSRNRSRFDVQQGLILTANFRDQLISSNDTAQTTDAGFAPWSETTITGALAYRGSSAANATVIGADYRRGSLVAEHRAEAPALGRAGEEMPLADLLTNIAETPADVNAFTQLADKLADPIALQEVSLALHDGKLDTLAMAVVAGALTAVGTEAAQEVLVAQVLLNPNAAAVQENALIGLLFLPDPQPQTVAAVEKLSQEADGAMREQATLILGALAHTINATAPENALRIVEKLQQQVIDATSEEGKRLALRALGNAGHPASLATIAEQTQADGIWVRLTAVDALRKFSGEAVDALLLARSQQDDNSAVRSAAQALYDQRVAAEIAAAAVNGEWNWSYTKWIGNGDIKGELTAALKVKDTPDIYLSANGKAIAHAWSWQYTLLEGKLLSEVVTQNGQIKRHSVAELKVLGNSIAKKEHYLVCGEEQSGSVLANGPLSQQFFSLSKSFYPWGIQVTLSLKASGSLDLKYKYKFTACNAPIQASAEGSLTPEAKVTATGDAMVSIYIARGGARITADILKTTLPASLMAEIKSGVFKACATLKLELQPISGKLRLWYQLRKLTGGWKPEQGWDVWSFSSQTLSQTLIEQCLP